ncbi:MAG: hypothetical protein ACRCYQ_00855 [Nocardioides sp.]
MSCTSADHEADGSAPWVERTLPMPPGPPGRIAVRDAVFCGGRWWVVGGVQGRDPGAELNDPGESRPAAWTSADLRVWDHVEFDGENFWARLSTIYSIGCRDGQVAMMGAKSGGAHGNPRVSTWYARSDGTFVDVIESLTQYGGAEGVNADRLLGSPKGWLISGNRIQGPAVWSSADARGFDLLSGAPQLSDDDGNQSLATDHAATPGGWAVVGRALMPGPGRVVPVAWTSPDGRTWTRESVPAGTEYAALERVVAVGDESGALVAVGLRGERFGVWRRNGGGWQADEPFGRLDPDRTAAPSVAGLAAAGDRLFATVSDGSRYDLWSYRGGWRRIDVPMRPRTGSGRVLTVAGHGRTVLLLGDDAAGAAVWSARADGT